MVFIFCLFVFVLVIFLPRFFFTWFQNKFAASPFWLRFRGYLRILGNLILVTLFGSILLYGYAFFNKLPNLFGFLINNQYIQIRKPWAVDDLIFGFIALNLNFNFLQI